MDPERNRGLETHAKSMSPACKGLHELRTVFSDLDGMNREGNTVLLAPCGVLLTHSLANEKSITPKCADDQDRIVQGQWLSLINVPVSHISGFAFEFVNFPTLCSATLLSRSNNSL